MKKQFLILCILGTAVSQVQGAEANPSIVSFQGQKFNLDQLNTAQKSAYDRLSRTLRRLTPQEQFDGWDAFFSDKTPLGEKKQFSELEGYKKQEFNPATWQAPVINQTIGKVTLPASPAPAPAPKPKATPPPVMPRKPSTQEAAEQLREEALILATKEAEAAQILQNLADEEEALRIKREAVAEAARLKDMAEQAEIAADRKRLREQREKEAKEARELALALEEERERLEKEAEEQEARELALALEKERERLEKEARELALALALEEERERLEKEAEALRLQRRDQEIAQAKQLREEQQLAREQEIKARQEKARIIEQENAKRSDFLHKQIAMAEEKIRKTKDLADREKQKAQEQVLNIAREKISAQLLSNDYNEKVIISIPGFSNLPHKTQDYLKPSIHQKGSIEYAIAVIALSQIVNYVYGINTQANRFVKLGDDYCNYFDRVLYDFSEMYTMLKDFSFLALTPFTNVNDSPFIVERLTKDIRKKSLITETVKAIVKLSKEFAKTASADTLLKFEDVLPGRPTQGVLAEVTALQPEDRQLAATDDNPDLSLKIYTESEEGALKDIMPLRSRTALPTLTVQAWARIFNNIIEFQTMQDLFFNQNISEKDYSDFIAKIDLPSLIQSMRFLLGENPDDYLINDRPMAPSHLQLFLAKLGINEASFDSIFGFIEITIKR